MKKKTTRNDIYTQWYDPVHNNKSCVDRYVPICAIKIIEISSRVFIRN